MVHLLYFFHWYLWVVEYTVSLAFMCTSSFNLLALVTGGRTGFCFWRLFVSDILFLRKKMNSISCLPSHVTGNCKLLLSILSYHSYVLVFFKMIQIKSWTLCYKTSQQFENKDKIFQMHQVFFFRWSSQYLFV